MSPHFRPFSIRSLIENCKLKIDNFSRGFTIIETLVAIAVLLLAVSAPLTIAERSLASAEVARQEITAFYLAQEAIEYIRNIRDANALAGRNEENWLQGLTDCLRSDGCGIDPTEPSAGQQVIRCNPSDSDNDCIVWQYTAGNDQSACAQSSLCGLFGHRKPPSDPEWTKTEFTRTVILKEIEDNIEVQLQVTVHLNAGALGTRAITVSENLMNWYDAP